jgi:hypothetical protein
MEKVSEVNSELAQLTKELNFLRNSPSVTTDQLLKVKDLLEEAKKVLISSLH